MAPSSSEVQTQSPDLPSSMHIVIANSRANVIDALEDKDYIHE